MLLEFTRVTSNFPHQLSQISFIGFTNLTKYDFNFLQTSYVRFHIVLPLTLRNPQRGMSTLPNEPFRNTAITITKVDKSSKSDFYFSQVSNINFEFNFHLQELQNSSYLPERSKFQVSRFMVSTLKIFTHFHFHTFVMREHQFFFKYFQLWCAFPGFHSTKTLLILKMLNAVVLLMDNG